MEVRSRAQAPLKKPWDLDQAIEQEQLRMLANHIHVGLLVSVVVAAFLVWGLTGLHPRMEHLVWLACVVIISAGRYWSAQRALAASEVNGNNVPLRHTLILGALVGGSAWGVAGVLFSATGDPLDLMLVAIVLGGVVAGAMATHFYYFPSYFAFATPSMLPLLILAFGRWQESHFLALGVLLLLYLAMNLIYSRQLARLAARAQRLELVTQNLLAELREQDRPGRADEDRDPLTGLPNHRRFEHHLISAWRALEGQGLRISLVLVEVVGVKRHRRELGQSSVDAAMRILAGVLESVCLEGLVCNTPARLAEDRFAILLHTDEVRARRIAQKVREMGVNVFTQQGLDLDLTVATASLEPQISNRPEQLLELALKRLRAARDRLGRHRRSVRRA